MHHLQSVVQHLLGMLQNKQKKRWQPVSTPAPLHRYKLLPRSTTTLRYLGMSLGDQSLVKDYTRQDPWLHLPGSNTEYGNKVES